LAKGAIQGEFCRKSQMIPDLRKVSRAQKGFGFLQIDFGQAISGQGRQFGDFLLGFRG
jgi:hypothetical protein